MNQLRKKIIYYYLVIGSIFYCAGWYLYQIIYSYSSAWSKKTGMSELVFDTMGFLIISLAFCVTAYIYYGKVKQITLEESRRQTKERNLIFANIAHDLKNPMASVLGFARALEEDVVAENEKEKVYHLIAEKSNQMNDMVLKMFQYAKMESEEYSLVLKEMDLCTILRDVIADRYLELEEHKIEVDIELPEERIPVQVDVNEFKRVVNNLITNVVKHNDEGIKVLFSVTKIQNNRVKIIVADSGSKIPREIMDGIFEPFQCSDVSRVEKNGSGLGLAITKRIVELHGGMIYIDDKVDGYTKAFVIEM